MLPMERSWDFEEWGFVIIFTAGFTPIPYKVFTLSAGVFSINFPVFLVASAVKELSIGAFGFGLSQLIFLWVLVTAKKGVPATDAVWDDPEGLEWTVPSPAPFHTFETPPETLPLLKQEQH